MRNRCKKCHKYEEESPRLYYIRTKTDIDSHFCCRACRKINRQEKEVLEIVLDHAEVELAIQNQKNIEKGRRFRHAAKFKKMGVV